MKSAPEAPSTSASTSTLSSTSSTTTTTGLTTLEVPSSTQVISASSPTGGKKTVMFAESVHVIIEEPRPSVSMELSQSSVPRPSTERPTGTKAPKGILKTKVRQETIEEVMNRILDEREKEAKSLTEMCAGALLTKYSSTGKPNKRWVSVSEDGTEIAWRKPSKTERRVDYKVKQIGRAVQQECRDRSRMPSSA
eukprot:TRINITY_DN5628_c0_g1_i2.p1 TRINITY_DN5628_c0_g1~~TRINITY_DN5628_c0_g1_i2.p1  ORF type:complete len:201 (-),score=17.72 TRINITY_DN5628_c0_g1_i2:27-608(-)